MRNFLLAGCVIVALSASGLAQNASQTASDSSVAHVASDKGQDASSAIVGSVTDATNAVIIGATVTVRDSSGHNITAITDATGRYIVSGLQAGAATLTISSPGFADFTMTVELPVGGRSIHDAQLNPQNETASVEVVSTQLVQVDTESAEVVGQLSGEQITGFGLNGRNFLSLLNLTPGVSNQTGQDEALVGVVGSAKFSINGGRTEYNSFDVDGNDVLNTDIAASHGHAPLLVYPSLDAIQDMKILTSNYGAQYGRSASGTVLISVKSGEDKYHGKGYDFIRNEAFNSRNFFDEPGKAPLYRRQDFGFTLGGPLVIPHLHVSGEHKTFFFLSEEWRKERTPVEFNQGVPSDAERGYNQLTKSYGNVADFSDVCPAANGGENDITSQYPDCPGMVNNGGNTTYRSFDNNQFYIDPNAKAFLQTGLIPRANANSDCVSSIGSCYVASVSPKTDYRQDLLRIDHRFNDKYKFFATLVHDHWQTATAVPQWSGNINSFPTVENSFLGPGISAIAHLTTVISPTMLNDFSAGATWQRISLGDVAGPGASLDNSALADVPNAMGSFFQNCDGGTSGANGTCIGGKIPGLIFSGSNAEYGGAGFNVDTSYMPWFHTRGVGTISDNVNKSLSKQMLFFGAQVVGAVRHEFGGINGANSGNQQGLLTFSNIGAAYTTANAFADFMINSDANPPAYNSMENHGGNIVSYQQDNTQSTYKVSYWTLEPYFQDNYKVTPHLMLNLGMRISIFQNWKPDGKRLYNWDPSAFDPKLMATSGISVQNVNGYLQDANANINGVHSPVPFDGSTLNPVLTNGLVECGANGVPLSCQTPHRFNASPRIGLAWDPTGSGKTSIRFGYGVFYEHGTGSEANVGSLMGNPPQVISMSENAPQSYADIGKSVDGTTKVPIESPLNMISIPDKTIWPYVQQWSFGVQREIDKDDQISVTYVGSKGTHLAVASQLNQLPSVSSTENPFLPGVPVTTLFCKTSKAWDQTKPYSKDVQPNIDAMCSGTQTGESVVGTRTTLITAQNSLRPYQGVGSVLALRNTANSMYNALQMTAHHAHGPLDLAASFTYSHSIDEASDRFSSTFVNPYNLATNRASSDFDQRVMINLNYVYQLPMLQAVRGIRDFFRPADTASSTANATDEKATSEEFSQLSKRIFDNWSLSGLTLYQTGTPFSVINSHSSNGVSMSDNAGLALDYGPDSYPDIKPQHGAPCFTRIVDTGAVGPIIGNACQFVAPRGLTQGNAGRNYLNNPSRTNFDVAVLKEEKLWQGSTLQFRAEAFNVLNNTQFMIYDPSKGNTTSNTISCYGDATAGYSAGASTCDVGNGFLHPVSAHRPRTMQFGLKLQF